ncbi:hypothetical protein [Streptomyces sp. NPDC051636]|uniref:hypothetical protein n=1 Tax=Streptomyces sp. NPDC051636 TaxID=3365663 RepID=UPI003788184E
MADLGRATKLVAATASSGLDERGVHGGEALHVMAGIIAFDAAEVFAGPGVQPIGQVLGDQWREEHHRQGDVDG